jgi:hypothetical protein
MREQGSEQYYTFLQRNVTTPGNSALGWGIQFNYSLSGQTIADRGLARAELRATDAGMANLLSDLYGPLRVPGTAEHVLSISSTASMKARAIRWEVHLDGTRLIRTETASIAFRHLLFEANRRAIDDRLQRRQRRRAIPGLDVAQVDLAFGVRRRGVDRLAALDDADVDGDATRQVGQAVHGDDLVRQLADGADALLEVAAGMGGLAGDLEG